MYDKRELRRAMKMLRGNAADRPARDRKIFENIFSLPFFAEKESFFLYNSFGSEADTRRIAEELLRRGKLVYFPRVEDGEILPVLYRGQSFLRGAYGIAEPEGEAFAGIPQVCVLPMLAADRSLYRLGYGGGYYDRWLARASRAEVQLLRVGICYHFQLSDELPSEAHDQPMDVLVTDEEILIRTKPEETR